MPNTIVLIDHEPNFLEPTGYLGLALEAARLGIWEWDLATNRFSYSARARAICGLPESGEVTYEDVQRVTHPEDFPFTRAQSRRALDPEIREQTPFEYRVVHPDGDIRWVVAHGEAVFACVNGTTQAVKFVGTLHDITDRKRLELSAQAAAARLVLALNAGRMAAWEVDVETDEVTGSPELNRLLGFPDEASPTIQEMRSRYYPGEGERIRAIGQAAMDRGERYFELDYRYIWPDGQVRSLSLRAEIQVRPDGAPKRVIGVVADITDQKAAQRELTLGRSRLELALSAASMVAWEWDLRTGEITRSSNADEMFGPSAKPEDIGARTSPNDALADRERLGDLLAGKVDRYESEHCYHHPDGRLLWIYNQGQVELDENGKPIRIIGAAIDVTGRREAQEALRVLNEMLADQAWASTAARDRLWDLSEDLLVEADFEGRLLRASPSWSRSLGWSEQELASTGYWDIVHPDDQLRALNRTPTTTRKWLASSR